MDLILFLSDKENKEEINNDLWGVYVLYNVLSKKNVHSAVVGGGILYTGLHLLRL